MDFLEKLTVLMQRDGYNKSSLSKACGIPYTTIDNWFKRGYDGLQLATLRKLNEFFDTTLEFWARDEINDPDYGKSDGFKVDFAEMQHIKKYRTLDGYGKDAVQAILDIEYNRCADAALVDETPKVISLRLSEQSAAAGTGTYLGPEQFRTIYVKESDIARRAAYCIPVSGDSMEPVYRDGDILLVSSEQAEIGDIGIFTLSGKGYVKKRGNDVLLSLNGKYVPIPMDESIVCNGKVIGVLDKSEIISNE